MLTLALFILMRGQSCAFTVLPSLNTYKKAHIKDAVHRVTELKSDGAWFITKNSDLNDVKWRAVFQALGGPHITEDNPGSNKSYRDYVRIMRREPHASFCYNETGGVRDAIRQARGMLNHATPMGTK